MFLCTGFWNSRKGPFISGEIPLGSLDLGWSLERDQALSLWSGSTDSKTLDYERTNPAAACRCQVASVVSDSVRLHRRQPTKLLRPWDFPGKSTGVGCHCLFQYCAAAASAKSLQSCPTLRPHRRQPTSLPRPWDSPGKNTGVGCHFLLQCMKVKSESDVAQLGPTLSDPMDCSPPGPSVHGICQARVLVCNN